MAIRVKEVSYDIEKQILVNLIISTKFCAKLIPIIQLDYFKAKSIQTILSWVIDHFNNFNEAPKSKMRDYFAIEEQYLGDDLKEQVKEVLVHLDSIDIDENVNVDYLYDISINLFRKKSLENQITAAQHHLMKGDLDAVEEVLDKRFVVDSTLNSAMSWGNTAFIQTAIQTMLNNFDEESSFFRYEGRLGDFIGNLNRGWFVAIIAPAKRGKTIYMVETIIAAMMRRLKVVFFSCEMPNDQIFARALQRITSEHPGQEECISHTPIFDCLLNQSGDCSKGARQGYGTLQTFVNGRPIVPIYEEREDWVVCTVCRGTKDFIPSSWYTPVKKKALNQGEYYKKANAFLRLYGKYVRSIFHPSRTADVKTLENDLLALQQNENFIPDVIVIDYADLLKPTRGNSQKRFELDEIWEGLRALGQSRKALIVSASQSNKDSATSDYISATDVAEDWSKIAKLDLGIGLCQNDAMKERGQININKIAFRHGTFVESKTCMVLQDLSYMQSHLDSEFGGR